MSQVKPDPLASYWPRYYDWDAHVPICMPQGYTSGQLVKVVVKDLNAHPEKLHLDAMALVLKPLASAFPCEWGSVPCTSFR